MSKTIEEMIKEVMSDGALQAELIAAMKDPAEVEAFLKSHDCEANVSEFIAWLDRYE